MFLSREKKKNQKKLIVSHNPDKFIFSFYRNLCARAISHYPRVVNSLEPYPITRSSVPMFLRTLHLYPAKIIHLSGRVMRNKPVNFIKIPDRRAPGFPGQGGKKTSRRLIAEVWSSKVGSRENP